MAEERKIGPYKVTISDLHIELILSGLVENEEEVILSREYHKGYSPDEEELLHEPGERTMHDATKYFDKEFTRKLLGYCKENSESLFKGQKEIRKEDFLANLMEEIKENSFLEELAYNSGLGKKYCQEFDIRSSSFDLIMVTYAAEEGIKEGWLKREEVGKDICLGRIMTEVGTLTS